jgi:hypothetical protein
MMLQYVFSSRVERDCHEERKKHTKSYGIVAAGTMYLFGLVSHQIDVNNSEPVVLLTVHTFVRKAVSK